MVGVLEVNAVSNLLAKGGSLALYIQEGYYKGSAARDDFPVQIDLLKKKHEEWSEQLREHGMAEDPNIKSLLESAAKSLEEEEKRVRKIRNSLWKKVKIMAFPDQLTLILKLIIDKIEAGPKLVASRVEYNDLLRKLAAQSRSVLPFGPDHKYVPIPSAVEKVQNALEDLSGPRVVTISGMPGLGKTGLAKHIALLYDKQLQQPLRQPCFPHGVHFLECGKGAYYRVRELQGLLLQSLGFEADSAPPESRSSQIQERGEYMQLESNKSKLRSSLLKRIVLIIFDEVWETELVQNLIVPGMGVKYLITSQIKDIWNDALNVELENPDMDQAIKIMARNTKGLSPPYEFTDCVKKEVEEIVRRLDFHPLSMTNVAKSMDHKTITDPKTWTEVKENIYEQLQEPTFHPNPSLRYFILEEKRPDLRSTATRILRERINGTADKSSDSGNSYASIPDALRLQLAAVYGGKSEIFREVILQTEIHDAPWISSGKDALDLVKSGGKYLRYDLRKLNLIRLLNVNSDEGGWEREANDSASKVLLRWICQGEFDDEGMARLLELPHTTSKACTALIYIFGRHPYGKAFHDAFCFDQGKTFSSSSPKTMKSLKDLVHNNAAEPTRRAAVVAALGIVANFETEETIMLPAEKWVQMLADNSTPGIQFAAANAVVGAHRLGLIMGACEGVVEALLDNMKSIEDKSNYPLRLDEFCQSKDNAVRIASIPGALEKILAAYVSDRCNPVPVRNSEYYHWQLFAESDYRLKALVSLSSVGENKIKFVPVLSSLLHVVENLLPVDPKHWYGSSYGRIGDMLNAARIVGNLGLVTEIRDIITARPSIRRGLLNLLEGRSENDQLNIFKCNYLDLCHFPSRVASRALTVLGVSYELSSTSSALSPLTESAGPCALMYMGRAQAKEELGLLSEALGDLNTALDYISKLIRPNPQEELRSDFSIEKLFTAYSQEYGYPSWVVRAEILSRSGLLENKIEGYHGAMETGFTYIHGRLQEYNFSSMEMDFTCALEPLQLYSSISREMDFTFNLGRLTEFLVSTPMAVDCVGPLEACVHLLEIGALNHMNNLGYICIRLEILQISTSDMLWFHIYTKYKSSSEQLELLNRIYKDREGAMIEAQFTHLLVLCEVVWSQQILLTFGLDTKCRLVALILRRITRKFIVTGVMFWILRC